MILKTSFPSLLKVRHCNTLSLTATVIFDVCCFLSLHTRTVFFDRVPMRWEELYDLQVEPSLFQLSYEALREQRLIVRKTTDRPKHQVYPDTLKYQCKLFGGTLRREENKFMQLSSCTCSLLNSSLYIKPLVYCSAILIPVKWFILWIIMISARFPHDE